MNGRVRSRALAAGAVLVAVAAGCASGGARPLASPACSSTNLPAWSPNGKQIAFVGRRLGHGPLPQRAICTATADGRNTAPLPQTLCRRLCRLDLIDSPSQLFWVRPNLLLYGDDFRIFTIPVAGTPTPLGRQPGSYEQFSVDSAGDRVAAGFSNCPQCAGPVTVLAVPTGRLVGRIGGTKVDNITPSISPDGTQVVLVRSSAGGSGQTTGIWTASANGSRLRRLIPSGFTPLWSPAGNRIAYLAPSAALKLVAPQGGASRTVVARNVVWLFGWSPNGKQIAFQGQGGSLDVVDVATGKVRKLMQLRFAPNVAWSPSSQELLVKTQPLRLSQCASLWRVPAGGGKPQRLRNC